MAELATPKGLALQIVMGKHKPGEAMSGGDGEDGGGELVGIAGDLIEAVKTGDAHKVASALQEAWMSCESKESPEQEDSEPESDADGAVHGEEGWDDPLKPGKANIGSNIKEMMSSGKSSKEAIAAALHTALDKRRRM